MEQIWWNRVPNAMRFISDIANSLLNEQSIILQSREDIPWHDELTGTIRTAVLEKDYLRRLYMVDDVSDPGAYLLEKLKPEQRAAYRPTKSHARFFAENDDLFLHQNYVWVRAYSQEQLEAWGQFVSGYIKERERGKEKAVFLLEWVGTENVQPQKSIRLYSLDEYICDYDRIVFCTLASSSVYEPDLLRKYLTELAVRCVGEDMELCAVCMANYTAFLKTPYAAIKEILRSGVRSDANCYRFTKTEAEINRLTWLAQIRTIYPALEEYRESFVQKNAERIEQMLPITSAYGEVYETPSDVELGTLKFMADKGDLYIKQREYDRLTLYKNARNKLSHLTPLSIEEIRGLI